MKTKSSVLVSICCITYNHERYIRQCLEGFIMQKCDFDFEILIHDDASTDNTAEIIKEYEAKYPDIIRPIYQTENQYSKGIRPISKFNWDRAKGKYIAMCEGDDYWTDPLKLQKQINFLEENINYGLSHTNVKFYYPEKKEFLDTNDANINLIKSEIPINERLLVGKYYIRTASVVVRKKLLLKTLNINDKLFNGKNFLMGDTPLWFTLSNLTHFHYLNQVTATYTFSKNSASRPNSLKKQLKFNLSMAELRMFLNEKHKFSELTRNSILYRYRNAVAKYKIIDRSYKPAYPYKEKWRPLQTLKFYITLKLKPKLISYLNKIE